MGTTISHRREYRNRIMETAVKIGILGGGNVGTKLTALMQAAAHDVVVGLRDPARAPSVASNVRSISEAVEHGEIIILAIPYAACVEVLPPLANRLKGKIVADATNPLRDDWSPLLLGESNSAGEEIDRLLPGAKVVKSFNMVFADIMTESGLQRDQHRATVFLASNDDFALKSVSQLAREIGFAPVIAGPLRLARYLEAMAHLNIAIAVGRGGGTNAAFIYDQVAA
jgi:8-hydroxy-5-deazaflavin:NADPH oxidoreductase